MREKSWYKISLVGALHLKSSCVHRRALDAIFLMTWPKASTWAFMKSGLQEVRLKIKFWKWKCSTFCFYTLISNLASLQTLQWYSGPKFQRWSWVFLTGRPQQDPNLSNCLFHWSQIFFLVCSPPCALISFEHLVLHHFAYP